MGMARIEPMASVDAVGWSGVTVKRTCKSCQASVKMQIVQTQRRIKLGPIKIINRGERDFGLECVNKHLTLDFPGNIRKEARHAMYYMTRRAALKGSEIHTTQSLSSSTVGSQQIEKYPVLTKERRMQIIKKNRKEGKISALLAIILGLVIEWFSIWGLPIMLVLLLGAAYATFEDPENQHRVMLNKERRGKLR